MPLLSARHNVLLSVLHSDRPMACADALDGYVKEVTPALERLLGRSRTELLSRSMFGFILPADIPKTLQALADLEDGADRLIVVNRWIHKVGSLHWLEWTVHKNKELGLWIGSASALESPPEV